MCMSVQCVHGTQGEPENVAMSTTYLCDFSLHSFVNVKKEQK